MQEIYAADGEPYYPVFYYYHTDHLGSATIMTDRDGNFIQHYGYTAFGSERYQHNTQSFSVTNRYTGQQIDEDTGLYFYNSRYYDPQLARFTQADTIVPSADTSQALNRYTYVKNNPLKFTDPDGHGWFKKFFKQWIGTILTVALCLIAPWGSGFWATLAYSVIGSAVSTIVNGGNFKSFAIGVGIGLAAGVVASGVGGYLAHGAEAWGAFAKTFIGAAMSAALTGAVAGAISSAVYGQNIGKGMLSGMQAGLTGFAVSMVIAPAVALAGSVIKEIVLSVNDFITGIRVFA